MYVLILIAAIIGYGIYRVTTLDFTIGSGITEDKMNARDVDYSETHGNDGDTKIELHE